MRFLLGIISAFLSLAAFGQTASQVRVIPTIGDLVSRIPVGTEAVSVLGRTEPGDSGTPRLFYATNAMPRGATNKAHSLASASTNNWWSSADWSARVQDIRWFGASSSAVDNRADIQSAIDYCIANGLDLDGPEATFTISGTLTNLDRVMSPARWKSGGLTIYDGTNRYRYTRKVPQAPTFESPWLSAKSSGLTNYWALGDSHTVGQINLAGTSNWLSGGYIVAQYRYPNIIASRYGLNLSNIAVSGSAISAGDVGTSGADLSTTLWQLSQVGPAWSGIMSVLHGYNDGLSTWQDTATAATWFESAQAATIATAFATNWVGTTGTNWFGVAVPGWTNSGTVYDEGVASKAVFPVSGASTGNRKAIRLSSGQTLSATLSGTVGIIFERWPSGGIAAVSTNGGAVGQITLDTQGNGYTTTARRLPAMFTLRLDGSTTVSITSVSGTNAILGIVWIGSEADAANKRLVMSGPTPLGDYSIRSDGMIAAVGSALVRAAGRWDGYPLWVTMAGASIDPDADVYSGDLSHPGPSGQAKLAEGFSTASPVNASGAVLARAQTESPVLRSWGGVQSFGSGVGSDYSRPSASLFYAGGYGAFLDAVATFGTYTNLFLRAYATRVQSGSLLVEGNSPSFGWLPTSPYLGLSMAGTNAYLDAFDSGVSQNPLAIHYRSKSHRFSNGSVSILANAPSVGDLPSGPALHLSQVYGTNYFDSLEAPSTYLTAIHRARNHRFGQGSVSILNNSSTADYLPTEPALHLSQVGGTNYIDALLAPSTWLPLTMRASAIRVTTGPLQVSGGIGSGLGAEKSVIIYDDGTNGYVRGYDDASYIPMAVDGSAVELRISGAARAKVDSSFTNNETALLLWDTVSNDLKRVYIGATNTGPGGGRALYIDGTPGGTNAAGTGGGGGATTLDGLTDVDAASPSTNAHLVWNGTAWVATNDLTLGTLTVSTQRVTGVLTVTPSAYASGWNGSSNVPSQDDIYDKIETMPTLAGANTFTGSLTISNGGAGVLATRINGGTATNLDSVAIGPRSSTASYSNSVALIGGTNTANNQVRVGGELVATTVTASTQLMGPGGSILESSRWKGNNGSWGGTSHAWVWAGYANGSDSFIAGRRTSGESFTNVVAFGVGSTNTSSSQFRLGPGMQLSVPGSIELAGTDVATSIAALGTMNLWQAQAGGHYEFLGDGVDASVAPLSQAGSSSGQVIEFSPSAAYPDPGQVAVRTAPSSAATSTGGYVRGGTDVMLWTNKWAFAAGAFLSLTNGTEARIGFANSRTSTEQTDGVMFSITNSTIYGLCTSNSIKTFTASAFTAQQGVQYRFVIGATNDTAAFNILSNGVSVWTGTAGGAPVGRLLTLNFGGINSAAANTNGTVFLRGGFITWTNSVPVR